MPAVTVEAELLRFVERFVEVINAHVRIEFAAATRPAA
jgi:hypothetical protein